MEGREGSLEDEEHAEEDTNETMTREKTMMKSQVKAELMTGKPQRLCSRVEPLAEPRG